MPLGVPHPAGPVLTIALMDLAQLPGIGNDYLVTGRTRNELPLAALRKRRNGLPGRSRLRAVSIRQFLLIGLPEKLSRARVVPAPRGWNNARSGQRARRQFR